LEQSREFGLDCAPGSVVGDGQDEYAAPSLV
jgi:hypothetical protein